LITGTLALGFMTARVDAVSKKSLIEVLSENVSKDSRKANLDAFECAWKMAHVGAGNKKR
jgi:Pyruvate/2-oxoacid:ferredoxin oxidoreductase gamma subunit